MNAKQFVEMVARLQTDDEKEGGWDNDDAWATVHTLIDAARQINEESEYKEAILPEQTARLIRQQARYNYGDSDDIAIDEDAVVNESGSGAWWVQAWVFVYRRDVVGGIYRSISDDDLCASCKHCFYLPGEESGCMKEWPGKFNEDGYCIECRMRE